MKVVCIKGWDDCRNRYPETFPVVDSVYTIRRHFPSNGLFLGSPPAYLLEEIVNAQREFLGINQPMTELCWQADHFRPVTDISSLVKLTKVRKLEDA